MIRQLYYKLHTFYIEQFKYAPLCIDCTMPMEYKGSVTALESANNVLPKVTGLVYRCDEDEYEIIKYKDGSHTAMHISEE